MPSSIAVAAIHGMGSRSLGCFSPIHEKLVQESGDVPSRRQEEVAEHPVEELWRAGLGARTGGGGAEGDATGDGGGIRG